MTQPSFADRPLGRRGVLAIGVSALLLGVAACSNRADLANKKDNETQPQQDTITVSPSSDGVQAFEIDATDNYRFVPSTIHVKPGTVKLTLVNRAKSTTHNLVFKPGGPDAEIPYLAPNATKTITFDVTAPGDYPFVCTFHESLGQKGKLIVGA